MEILRLRLENLLLFLDNLQPQFRPRLENLLNSSGPLRLVLDGLLGLHEAQSIFWNKFVMRCVYQDTPTVHRPRYNPLASHATNMGTDGGAQGDL